jgi:membrane associated rhomboid family serine protease
MSSPPGPSVPTCYRHSDRETYIRCARCERLICPDCMTAAPVGYQCPECVRQGSRSVREAQTPLGGKVHERGNLVTLTLIGLNVAIWLAGAVAGFGQLTSQFALVALGPVDGQLGGVLTGEWYRMISAAFVHVQVWHIALNMFALWILGTSLEPVLGRWRFIVLYLMSALGGSTASLMAMGFGGASIGASGAVFGLFGALFVVARRFGRNVSAVLLILGINVVIGFTIEGIDWRAHLGGLVTGVVLAYAFAHAPRSHRAIFSMATVAVVAAIMAWVNAAFVA